MPATLLVVVRDPKLSSAQLDPLLNRKMNWSVVTERWREGLDMRHRSEPQRGLDSGYEPSGLDERNAESEEPRSTRHLDRDDF